jgi:replication initiation protein RepC
VRQVLGELAACYGEQELQRGLMVWPSNEYLCRKTGLAERTIRKCIRALIDAELIEPVDSANRKRFAVRGPGGIIRDAYGFNLEPIYARRAEFAGVILEHQLAAARRSALFDELTIQRKGAEEALRALRASFPAVECHEHETAMIALLATLPRRSGRSAPDAAVAAWLNLRTALENLFFEASRNQKESGRAGDPCRHKEPDKNFSIELCQRQPEGCDPVRQNEQPALDLIVEACPAAAAYSRPISNEDDLIRIGRELRGSLGASAEAWVEATEGIGLRRAAALVLYVLQLADDDQNSGEQKIRKPGGLFRHLARKLAEDQMDFNAELMALRRRHLA